MDKFPKKLTQKLDDRIANESLRKLTSSKNLVDFSSNDYLGLARDAKLFKNATSRLNKAKQIGNGATGSRLLSGNHVLYEEIEKILTKAHKTGSALVFNSGYDANIGFFSSVPQRGDYVFYDELVNARLRDGIRMSNAKSYRFKHNEVDNLAKKITQLKAKKNAQSDACYYVVTESVFSMDGDSAKLNDLANFCAKNRCYLVVEEAHALCIFGGNGEGLVQALNLENSIFARIITFGKAMGSHGAAVLGSKELKSYLVNYARSLIYTTGLPPHTIATIIEAYENNNTPQGVWRREELKSNIRFFKKEISRLQLSDHFLASDSAIHCCLIPGNKEVKKIATKLQQAGFDVKPILSPTVGIGKERLRICLHRFNTEKEMKGVLELLTSYM